MTATSFAGHRRVRVLVAGLAVAVTAALCAAAAPSAQALAVVTCGGSQVATYSPPLTNTRS